MQRSSSLYVAPNCGGSSVTIPPLLASLTNVDQQQQHYGVVAPIDGHTFEPNLNSLTSGRSSLKRKLHNTDPEEQLFPVSVTVAPYSAISDTANHGTLVAKSRKDTDSGIGIELHEFPAFGQAFQGVSGIGQFYVIGPNDTNNNNPANALGETHEHHQQLATYIYDVPSIETGADVNEAGPMSEQHLTSTVLSPVVTDVVHQANGIVLADISSSTWTSTAELLDLDRKSSTSTLPTNMHHHRYSIVSTELHHNHQQQQEQQQQQQQQQQQHHHHHHHHHHQQHQHNNHQQHQQQHHHQQLQHLSSHHLHHHQQQQQPQQHQQPHHHQQQTLLHVQAVSQIHAHHQPPQQSTSSPPSPCPPPPLSSSITMSTPSAPDMASQQILTCHNNQDAHQQQRYSGNGDDGSSYISSNNKSSASNWSNSGDPCRTADESSPCSDPATLSAGVPHTNGMKTPERLASQTPDTPEDCKNLSWLLNFKLDDIPNLSPRSNRKQRSKAFAAGCGPETTEGTSTGNGYLSGDTGTVAIEEGDLNVGENVTIESSNGKSPKKPPFTYTELIEYALEEQGDLTVAAIYQWISDHFPYYKSHDDRWKNSVRHNLSINPHFRKGRKSSHGSGHLWTISSRNSEDNFLAWEHKKQRFEWFFKMEANARMREVGSSDTMTDAEVAAATASLAQYVPKSPTAASPGSQSVEPSNPPASEQHRQHITHTLHQQQQQHAQQPITASYHEAQTLYADIISSAQFKVSNRPEENKHVDDETFTSLRRGSEIHIDRPTQTIQTYEMLDSEYNIADYLNPVPKEEIVQECGLRSVALDPAELGINIPSASGQDDDILFDDFNLNYFGNNIMT